MRKRKTEDLRAWHDYFAMLQVYEKRGMLELADNGREAFVTLPALHAMTEGDDPAAQLAGPVRDTAWRIRAFSDYRNAFRGLATDAPFALHVVRADAPHDALYTMLLTRRRRWWKPWVLSDAVEYIYY